MPPPTQPPPPKPPARPGGASQDPQLRAIQEALKAQAERQKAQAKQIELMTKKDQARDILVAMITRVQEKMTDLRAAATLIGTAYSRAAKHHRDAVAKQNQMNALDAQVMFAVLSVFSAGALSWATGAARAMQAANAAKKVADATANAAAAAAARAQDYSVRYAAARLGGPAFQKWASGQISTAAPPRNLEQLITVTSSTVSAGVGAVFGLAPNHITPPSTEPVSEEPLEFQNKLESRIDTIHLAILTPMRKLAEQIRDTPIETWDKYNDAEFKTAYDKWEREANELAGKQDLPSETDMANELERCIWAVWMPSLKTSTVIGGGCTEVGCSDTEEVETYVRLRKPANDRFVTLGIETEEQTDWKREREDKFLLGWADQYFNTAKPWVTGKAKAARVK